jgi:hypothetical protein
MLCFDTYSSSVVDRNDKITIVLVAIVKHASRLSPVVPPFSKIESTAVFRGPGTFRKACSSCAANLTRSFQNCQKLAVI